MYIGGSAIGRAELSASSRSKVTATVVKISYTQVVLLKDVRRLNIAIAVVTVLLYCHGWQLRRCSMNYEDDYTPYPGLPDETIDLVVPSGIMLWRPSDMALW